MKKIKQTTPFYNLRSILGYNWATFYILLGGAQAGKSYSVMDFCLKQKIKYKENNKFYWFRLKDNQSKALLKNNAAEFIDPDLLRKYDLTLNVVGTTVYSVKYQETKTQKKDGSIEIKQKEIKSERFELAKILDLSTFYNDKGVGYFDKDYNGWYNICIDEFQPEKGERRTFDIIHAFVRSLENIVRNSKTKVRVFMMANLLEEASDILACFNFIPEEFGRYKLVKNKKILKEFIKEYNDAKSTLNTKEIMKVDKKYENYDFGVRAVIDYLEPTEDYKRMRKGSIADRLLSDNSEYSNVIVTDSSLVYRGRLNSPTRIIKFSKDKRDWFTVWDGKIIAPYNKENKEVIAMKPYLDEIYNTDLANKVIQMFDYRVLLFKNLITLKYFQSKIAMLKPRGN